MSRLPKTATVIDAAADVVATMLDFTQPADAVLSNYFRNNRELGPHERGFVADTAYAVLRRKRFLERLCGEKYTPRQLVLAALMRVQGMSQRQLSETLSAAEGKWLTEFKARPEPELTPAEQCDLPDWLYEKLAAQYSSAQRAEADGHLPLLEREGGRESVEDFESLSSHEWLLKLSRSLNQPAPLDLRVNSLKATRDEVLELLGKYRITAEPCRYAPFGIRLKEKPALSRETLFIEGKIEVQDEGSQLLGHLLQPKRGEMVADFCAGAGGKTLLLGALMRSTGRLYAFDVSDKRLAKLKPRLARSGLSNVHPAAIASENDIRIKRLAGKMDRVLVDAPCSGLGTLRRNPDLKWRQTPQSVEELTRKQAAILAAAARLVKPGGRVVYATCSLLHEENEDIVGAFLVAHEEFHRLSCGDLLRQQSIALDTGDDLRLFPHLHGTDGFYAAVLERKK
ncbi:SAM-dependent methyltransferase [Georgfuchsia toluolica]|uniref:SAM-dependent methyltransferase n=1 Tax=Georgfuchsia toluolica TaxID=424218 RepID=A0A916J519_9PROT|nr:RsmB/NOP family class I SAM-dependent RNA methyltransferase [Georgfuchsia toluolica]CAG4882587.1 SAM-dependent methyltransferase [Georgfuchsia toluolica]